MPVKIKKLVVGQNLKPLLVIQKNKLKYKKNIYQTASDLENLIAFLRFRIFISKGSRREQKLYNETTVTNI